MKKLFTIEIDRQGELIEMHLNKEGAVYLRDVLNRLIEINANDHLHLMTPDWGGNELSSDQQNLDSVIKIMHQLKIIYWKES
jgi:hypothetical protein